MHVFIEMTVFRSQMKVFGVNEGVGLDARVQAGNEGVWFGDDGVEIAIPWCSCCKIKTFGWQREVFGWG